MTVSALALGATLYVPATRTDMAEVLYGARRPAGLRSAVLCLEDAVLEREVPLALANLGRVLRLMARREPAEGDPLVFARPRDVDMLARILRMPGAERLNGFVIPKAQPDTMPAWLSLPFHENHRLMPTLETREALDPWEVRRLRDLLTAVQDRILALRIGGNDLLQCLGLRRAEGHTAYGGPLGPVIAGLAAAFLPWGFELSAPVMERFDDPHLLNEEMRRDIEHGLTSKTAVHPSQIAVIQAALAVPANQLEEARLILDPAQQAVFSRNGVMCEPATHRVWATRLVDRAARFGVADPLPLDLPLRA